MAAPTVKQRAAANTTGALMTATLASTPTKGNLLVVAVGFRGTAKAAFAGYTEIAAGHNGTNAPTGTVLAKIVGESEPKELSYTPGNVAAMEVFELAPAAGSWKSVAEAVQVASGKHFGAETATSATTPEIEVPADCYLYALMACNSTLGTTTVGAPFTRQLHQPARSAVTADASPAAGKYACAFTGVSATQRSTAIIAFVSPSAGTSETPIPGGATAGGVPPGSRTTSAAGGASAGGTPPSASTSAAVTGATAGGAAPGAIVAAATGGAIGGGMSPVSAAVFSPGGGIAGGNIPAQSFGMEIGGAGAGGVAPAASSPGPLGGGSASGQGPQQATAELVAGGAVAGGMSPAAEFDEPDPPTSEPLFAQGTLGQAIPGFARSSR